MVFYQCALGARSRKPTRLLTDLVKFKELGPRAWPRLDLWGRYIGPLPASCSCGHTHSGLIKRSAEDAFSTTEAASYPPALDVFIACAIWQFASSLPAASLPVGGQGELQLQEGKEGGPSKGKDEKKGGELGGESFQEERRQAFKEDPKETHKRRKKDGEAGEEIKEFGEESREGREAEDEVEMLIESARREAYKDSGGKVWAPIPAHYKGIARFVMDWENVLLGSGQLATGSLQFPRRQQTSGDGFGLKWNHWRKA